MREKKTRNILPLDLRDLPDAYNLVVYSRINPNSPVSDLGLVLLAARECSISEEAMITSLMAHGFREESIKEACAKIAN